MVLGMNTILNNYSASITSSVNVVIPDAVKIALADLYNKKPIEITKNRYGDLMKEKESKI
jgi:hypothetical protein